MPRKKTKKNSREMPRISIRVFPGTIEAAAVVREKNPLIGNKSAVMRYALAYGLDAFVKDSKKLVKAAQIKLPV